MKWEMGTKIAKLFFTIAAVYLGIKYIFPIVLPFFIALLLAKLLYPLAMGIEKKIKLNRALSRSAAYFLFLGIMGGILGGILYLCYRMGSTCLENITRIMAWADEIFDLCCQKIEMISGVGLAEIQGKVNEEMAGVTDGAIDFSKEAGVKLMAVLAKVLVTCVATLLILNDYEKIVAGIKKTPIGKRTVELLKDMRSASGEYLKAQLKIMGIVTGICILGLWLLKTKYAFGIGILVGICDAFPFLGTGTVFVPWAIIMILLGEYKKAAGYLVLYLLCTFTRQMLEPKLVGNGIGVPPLAVLMSIYIGLQLYGVSGVILGPVSALIIYEIWKSLDKSKEQSLQ
ncbi:MAG: AI-2E family transporter [Lachnospiraceae bacterium]|nr:AI-2E family transporter [Lachnospiraceae bacterium]